MKLDNPEHKVETPGACHIPVTVDPDDLDECSIVESSQWNFDLHEEDQLAVPYSNNMINVRILLSNISG